MIVYGDSSEPDRLKRRIELLAHRLDTLVRRGDGSPSLDDLRTLLIQSGELEQAVSDALPTTEALSDKRILQTLPTLTDLAAEAFYIRWTEDRSDEPRGEGISTLLRRMKGILSELNDTRDLCLTINAPEGFACYLIYPEQYCAAARKWAEEHADNGHRSGIVVGLRSIGTTLSAVVRVALEHAGYTARRMTVRPTGDPYARKVELDDVPTEGPCWGWVVDEGPGLSGSSMAATAQALEEGGVDPSRIVFFTSHAHGPGPFADEAAQARWKSTPCSTSPLEDLRWEGKSLTEALAARTKTITGERVLHTDELSGGGWRWFVYGDISEWPEVYPPLDVKKYRYRTETGREIVWKFAGLGSSPGGEQCAAEGVRDRLQRRADLGWTPPPMNTAFGFVATPWVEGAPVNAEEANSDLLTRMGRYIADVAGPPLSPSEGEAARTRLREMLYWNTWEVMGEEWAERTHFWCDRAEDLSPEIVPYSSGDGRMAPREWIRTPAGRIFKVDAGGHERDLSPVGKQTYLWDIAGAWVEWDLTQETVDVLLGPILPRLAETIPPHLLGFYRMAYAAYRMGACAFHAGQSGGDPQEQERLYRASEYYRGSLEHALRD